jgi:hypothetical protein
VARRLIIPTSVRQQLDRLDAEDRLVRTDPQFEKYRDQWIRELYPVARAWILREWRKRDPERAMAAFALVKGKAVG